MLIELLNTESNSACSIPEIILRRHGNSKKYSEKEFRLQRCCYSFNSSSYDNDYCSQFGKKPCVTSGSITQLDQHLDQHLDQDVDKHIDQHVDQHVDQDLNQFTIEKPIKQAMLEEKAMLVKGFKDAELFLKTKSKAERARVHIFETLGWYRNALKSYNQFEEAYKRLKNQYVQWASKAFDPDAVQRRWGGILLNGNRSENRILYVVAEDGKPVRSQPDNIKEMSDRNAEDRFFKLMEDVHVHCLKRRRLGAIQDGGWDVCTSGPYKPKQNDCLVYSFGMGIDSHQRSERVYFHSVGLADTNFFDKKRKWPMKTLDTLFKENGHSDKIITYLKVDIEGWELTVFKQFLKTNLLKNVMQLSFENHINSYNKEKLYEFYTVLYEIEKLGFKKYHYHSNFHCIRKSRNTGLNRSMCNEVYYINTNFLP